MDWLNAFNFIHTFQGFVLHDLIVPYTIIIIFRPKINCDVIAPFVDIVYLKFMRITVAPYHKSDRIASFNRIKISLNLVFNLIRHNEYYIPET